MTCRARRLAVAVVAAFGLAAVASEIARAFDVPVSQIHALAQTYEPGLLLPSVFPSAISHVEVGATAGPGAISPPDRFLAYHTPTREGFQLSVWRGAKRTAVVAALMKHDGARGSTRPFRAGRFAGILEVQRQVSARLPIPVAYVWQSGRFTYLLAVRWKPGTSTPVFPGLDPLATIGSFRV